MFNKTHYYGLQIRHKKILHNPLRPVLQHFAHIATQRKRYAGPIDSAFRLQMTAVCAQILQMTAKIYCGRMKSATVDGSLEIVGKSD